MLTFTARSHATRVGPLALVSLVVLPFAGAASAAPPEGALPAKLDAFLSGGGVCSNADFEGAVRAGSRLELAFAIDAVTGGGLGRLDAPARDDWLALHCPPVTALRAPGPTIERVRVNVAVRDGPDRDDEDASFSLDCAAHAAALGARRERVREEVDARLRERLSRRAASPSPARADPEARRQIRTAPTTLSERAGERSPPPHTSRTPGLAPPDRLRRRTQDPWHE